MSTAVFIVFVVAGLFPWAAVGAPARAVAVLYDDSGSMNDGVRWPAANFSLQVLASLLSDGDELYLVKMNRAKSVRRFAIPTEVNGLLKDFQSEQPPTNSTPYDGVQSLLEVLAQSQAPSKWLVIVTDGGFDKPSYNDTLAKAQIDSLVNPLGIRSAYLLIGRDSNWEAAQFWEKQARSKLIKAENPKDLPKRMEELAAEITGRDSAGLTIKANGNEIEVSSKFPLRNLVVMAQGAADAQITSMTAGSVTLVGRSHGVVTHPVTTVLPRGAVIGHMSAPSGIATGERVASIGFNKPVGDLRIKVFPEVAASHVSAVRTASGKVIAPSATGEYEICDGESVQLYATLQGADGKSLLLGRNDHAIFDVGFFGPQGLSKAAMIADQSGFALSVQPKSSESWSAYAKYPGYFDYRLPAFTLKPIVCKREVKIELVSRLDADGRWAARVDRVEQMPELRFRVSVNGNLVDPAELASWTLSSDAGGRWLVRSAGSEIFVRARGGCCALTWSRPKAEIGQLALTVRTTNTRDVVVPAAPVPYEFFLPENSFSRYAWLYLCPLLFYAGIVAFCFYILALMRKERFGRASALHWRRGRQTNFDPFVRGKHFIKRWFWPSKFETRSLQGHTFRALGNSGAAVLLMGKSLTIQDETDDWEFDPDLAARKQPQKPVRLRHQSTLTRYRGNGRRLTDVELTLQYAKDKSPAHWPTVS